MKKGFTLVELVMVLAVGSVIVLFVFVICTLGKEVRAQKVKEVEIRKSCGKAENEKDYPAAILNRAGYTGTEFYIINVHGCEYVTSWNGEAIVHLANCTNCNKKVITLEKGEK